MYTSARALTIIFSLCLHGSLVGLLTFFSAEAVSVQEKVYQVSLAEFAPVSAAGPVAEAPAAQPAAPPAPVEPSPPVPPEPVVKPEPPKPVEPEKKNISPKKRADAPKPKPQPKPQQAPPPPVAAASPASNEQSTSATSAAPTSGGSATGGARQVGGLMAHDVDRVDQRPSISRQVTPEYPTKARRMNVEGNAVVRLVVDTSGQPQSCAVHVANPPGYFEEAALKAARKTRFIPGKIQGQPVNTVVLIPFRFALR